MAETDIEFDRRLCTVIAEADTVFFDDPYYWRPLGGGCAPSDDSLACVYNGDAWFEFAPASDPEEPQQFRVVRFAFSENGPSAIGFVAWLHSHLRTMGKTGAIVICGKDSRQSRALFDICQGAMDYWACPVGPAGDRFLEVIRTLIARGRALRGTVQES